MESSGDATTTLLSLVFAVISIVIMWKVYTKAGRAGWASLIPIYNIYTLLKIAGRPGWWTILYFIPIVNIVIAIITSIDVAKAFGKDTLFGVVGLVIFSIIGYGILAFGDATYTQPDNS